MLDRDKHKVAMYQILTRIFKDASLAASLGLKGGTACYFFYGLPRFSVDLDFNLITQEDDQDLAERVFARMEGILTKLDMKIKNKHLKTHTIFFLLSYQEAAQNIKIEISRRDLISSYEQNLPISAGHR